MSELVRITRVLSLMEVEEIDNEARASGFYHHDRRVFLPGWAWYQPFYFDPRNEWQAFVAEASKRWPDHSYRERPMIHDAHRGRFLSPHYWRDWSTKRPPICVVCPNGEQWNIDRTSSNGDGWTVTGELPNITCAPSIVVPGYHGYLRDGEFCADLEGRGPRGLVAVLPLTEP
jgi:hypothetical protein